MLLSSAFCLNLLLASSVAVPTSLSASVDAKPQAPTSVYSSATVTGRNLASTTATAVDEDIFVFGDPLHKELKGKLKGAFEAFEKGNFKEAERQFGKLASNGLVRTQRQRWNELDLPNIFALPLNRKTTFSTDRWDALSETPVSASRAIARSHFDLYSTARLNAAASKLYLLKGLAQAQQGKTEKALKSYRKALALYKNNVDARVEYALLLLRKNDLKTSGKQLKKLDKIFGAKCRDNRCKYAPESKERYGQIKLAYANILAQTEEM